MSDYPAPTMSLKEASRQVFRHIAEYFCLRCKRNHTYPLGCPYLSLGLYDETTEIACLEMEVRDE